MDTVFGRVAAVAATLALVSFIAVPAATAHGDDETGEGYLLVQQALGHLAHDTGAEGLDLAMEKVQDALDTEDQEGVDVAEVEQAMAALEQGDADRARTLLQDSIKEALAALPPATGNETGTTVVEPELPGRDGLHGQDWLLLAVSVAALLLGSGLAVRFRPPESVRTLRSLLTTAPAREDD